jgi:hypothetical protein
MTRTYSVDFQATPVTFTLDSDAPLAPEEILECASELLDAPRPVEIRIDGHLAVAS